MAGALLFDRQVTLKASLNHRAATACSCSFKNRNGKTCLLLLAFTPGVARLGELCLLPVFKNYAQKYVCKQPKVYATFSL
jgi:hypothetical protein